ncbi:MAG: exo-alpha-sialidase [Pirellulales bacterium]|nr:exo-alpha-sialidase [Pirellulales bacterium]
MNYCSKKAVRCILFASAGLVAVLSLSELAGAQSAQEKPYFALVDLFEAGEAGYTTYRAPTILISPKGTLLVSTEARKDGFGDWSDINTIIRRSTDGGKTWKPPQTIIDDGLNAVNNNTFIVDRETGKLHLMHAINYERVYWRTSSDDGIHWTAPREITEVFNTYRTRDDYPWIVVAPGMSPGIVLQHGKHKSRFVVPVWLALEHRHRPSICTTVYSDDRGATWHAGEVIARDGDLTKNPSETVVIELSDGRVMAHIRNESPQYRRAVSFSPDGASDWTTPRLEEQLYDPICQASLARYSPSQLLFSNPDSSKKKEKALKWNARRRENLTIRLSNDDGKTWPVSKVLDSGLAGYSQLAVDDKGMIYCVYERGNVYERHGKFSPKYVSVAKFNMAWLLSGSDKK